MADIKAWPIICKFALTLNAGEQINTVCEV